MTPESTALACQPEGFRLRAFEADCGQLFAVAMERIADGRRKAAAMPYDSARPEGMVSMLLRWFERKAA